MFLSLQQYCLALLSGAIVGLSLGLVGGGGSILALPLIVYLVGVSDPHIAIGTTATVVAVNAAVGLFAHSRTGTVRWDCAILFAAFGAAGAFLGSLLGKSINGQRLLFLFAVLMMIAGLSVLSRRTRDGDPKARLTVPCVVRILSAALLVGTISGFFGIGGGFLIVPSLIWATDMSTIDAIGSSLASVTAFASTTTFNYAMSGKINWVLAAIFIGGGSIGSLAGAKAAWMLAGRKETLNIIFASVIFAAAAYVMYRSVGDT